MCCKPCHKSKSLNEIFFHPRNICFYTTDLENAFSNHCNKNILFIWYSDVLLAEQFHDHEVFPAKNVTLKLQNKVIVFCLWFGKKIKIGYFQLLNHFLRGLQKHESLAVWHTNLLGWEIPQRCILQQRLRLQQPHFLTSKHLKRLVSFFC